MAKYVFRGGYPRYYPTVPLFAKPGEVHDLDAAPDAEWSLADPETAPVAPISLNPTPVPQVVVVAPQDAAPDVEAVADDALRAAEALLEANPELARKLVEEVKNA